MDSKAYVFNFLEFQCHVCCVCFFEIDTLHFHSFSHGVRDRRFGTGDEVG